MTLHRDVFANHAALAQALAERLDGWGAEAQQGQGRFRLSVAGGNTPRALYPVWATHSRLDWERVDLLFGDERCVPPQHRDSNYRMVREALLEQAPIPPRVWRMPGEQADPDAAAAAYEATLHTLLGPAGRIDVALLGMGGDGHTASLFPHAAALGEQTRWCVATPAPDGRTMRLTLTYPLLCRARRLVFLITGSDKAATLARVVQGPADADTLPAQRLLREATGDIHLLLDEAAAGLA
jgi:6-phosphogluconolactonase